MLKKIKELFHRKKITTAKSFTFVELETILNRIKYESDKGKYPYDYKKSLITIYSDGRVVITNGLLE